MNIRLKICILLAAALLLLSGCASQAENSQTGAQGSVAIVAPSASPTPLTTETAASKPEAAPSAQSSAPPSASPLAENGKTVVADGFYFTKLTDGIKKRITGMSFPAKNAKISYDSLLYIGLAYYDFNGAVHTDGELIVSAKLAAEVTQIFCKLYQAKYAFTSIRLVDDYGEPGDDNLSMAANNTSAFNYRFVTGTNTLSLHSYGDAIDINPRLNPYIENGRVSPANAAAYTDRSQHLPGMIDHNDLCYKLFTDKGWKWGGDASGDKDYQHFSKKVDP